MLRITPLYGSHFNPHGEAEEPTCTLIELSNCRCLINVGYNPTFWNQMIHSSVTNDELIKRIPDHDCVFIMNSTWQCVGGLPLYYEYIRAQYNNGSVSFIPPIYATYPTIKMGQMTLYDYHATIAMDGNSPPYTLQSIDNVFASITAIKFSQQIFLSSFSGRASTHQSSGPQLSVTAHRAGYVVGGAYYVIQRLSDETVIVFTDSAYHMSKELHLEACTLLQHGTTTPDVFMTRPGGPPFRQIRALFTNDSGKTTKQQKQKSLQQPLVAQAERNLIESILAVLRRDGNVLLPVDTSGRVLELLLLLHYEWEQQRYMNAYNLIYFAPMCHNVLDYAKSQLEWMSNALNTQFADHGKHPYRFSTTSGSSNSTKTIQVCTSLSELNTILEDRQNPSCVLASGLSLEGGPSRDVLLKWADNPDNAIIFTDSSQCYVRRTFYDGSRITSAVNASSSVIQEQVTLLERSQAQNDNAIGSLNDGIIQTSESAASVSTSAMIATPIDKSEAEEADEDVTTIGEALTDTTKSIWTTAGQLLHAWVHAKAMGIEMADSVIVDVNVPIRAPLSGLELKTFLAQEEAKRQAYIKAAEKRAMLAQVELAKGQLHLGEDDGTVPMTTSLDGGKPALNATSSGGSSTAARGSFRPKKKSRFDSSLFLKFSKPLHSKIPVVCLKFFAIKLSLFLNVFFEK
jgi:cleavage and polyadenylation specificity factor subunit 2